MIHLLATTYQKKIAFLLFLVFDGSFMFTPLAYAGRERITAYTGRGAGLRWPSMNQALALNAGTGAAALRPAQSRAETQSHAAPATPSIGGPTQPEMTSFKTVNANNLVNLFTGDFNYNIPLLDVGGYPVNMYYSGGIGLEQEASWVGLGWNINPGNINRNMRGIPDDFDGTDTLIQSENMKPNKTWGVSVGGDLEGVGIKALSLGANIGMSFNNYLGPALDLGVKGGVNFKVGGKVAAEKSAQDSNSLHLGLSLGASVSADLNSREGLTISPSVSLAATGFKQNAQFSEGVSIATSYNSRSGIKALQISEQSSLNSMEQQNNHGWGNYGSLTERHFGTTISFARPSYIPSIRMPMVHSAFSGHFQLGGGIFGIYGSLEAEAYFQTSKVEPNKIIQRKPMVGYLYYENATTNPEAVMDFTRFNDKEVTPHTPIISAPQYTYDVFTIQGEGTGGSVRAYRTDMGLVRDNHTSSTDNSAALGVDIGPPGHWGANFNMIKTPTEIEEWTAGNKLADVLQFAHRGTGKPENVFFRNPGEACVLENAQYAPIGGADLVRFQLSGDPHSPNVEPVLDRYSKAGLKTGTLNVVSTAGANGRRKRTQVIDFLTAGDASVVGLDKYIRSYDYQTPLDAVTDTLRYTSIPRLGGYRKTNHISQINVTESNGKRYVYGVPVYNIRQKDFTFTVSNSDLTSPSTIDKVSYAPGENNVSANPAINGGVGSRDGFVEITETPAYAHSFLLSGLLSPDYVDVTGDGITDDDLGDAVKFNYSEIKQADGNPAVHAWRSPADANSNMANFNAGKRTFVNDDKGLVSYGERESWYLHSIESKTMIALFTLQDRQDGKGVSAVAGQSGENAGINALDKSTKCLKQIDLYSKSDLKKNGLANARPIKTVHFSYSYRLCNNTPDDPVGDATGKGKLTLDSVYFTYYGQNRAIKNKYIFAYGSTVADNPGYTFNASDRWGTYKPATMNPADKSQPNMKNSDYPFTPQEQAGKVSPRPALDQDAGAWSLKTVVLPSGGQIDVQYESDDYAYVQNKRAAEMMNIIGFSNSPTGTVSNRLYENGWNAMIENNVVFIQVPVTPANDAEVGVRYLQGMDQLALKIGVDMPAGVEYMTCYANIVASGKAAAGKFSQPAIWVQLKLVSGLSPLSLTAVEYLREQLPGQAFPGYDVSGSSGLEQIGTELAAMLASLKSAFRDPVTALRSKGMAQTVELGQSFARLNDPLGFKYGGGHRVKTVSLSDNWQAMTHQFTSVYRQTYGYTTTESFNGALRTISSGVASYEPAVGGEENPFQTIVQVADKLPLGPASYGALEMPVLEAFFPAAGIGYSKVTVRSLPSVAPGTLQKSRSGIGRQVTEFYTAKDYPVYYNQTALDPATDLQAHNSSSFNFFYKYAFDSRALSQGFVVETNDMHGKMRSQTAYAENDTTLRVSYTENFYRNTGGNGLNETFNTISAAQGGVITPGNIGIDIELMTDVRQFTVTSSSLEIQGQVDLFPVVFPFWLPFIWPVTGNSENDYRAVTTTKVISYHALLDSVVVYDKGSQVSTKNLVYDGETGEVIVTRTNNAFNKPVYNTTYPAWWAYPGMGPAYVNTGVQYSNLTFSDGKITAGSYDPSLFESGDELYVTNLNPSGLPGCPPLSAPVNMLWTLDRNKNNPPFPIGSPNFIFIDTIGRPYTRIANIRVVRSGFRNMLDATLASVSSLGSPIVVSGSTQKLSPGGSSQPINASAMEYSEKWQVDKGVIGTFTTVSNQANCSTTEVPDCNGHLDKGINPYRKGLLGNFRGYKTMTFYDNRAQSVPGVPTNISTDGALANFTLYWDFDATNALVPNTSLANWIETNRVNRVNSRGLQLETKNAANIYTAAQYGYGKTLPVAITNNSPYYQSFYDGFEDRGYTRGLDNDHVAPCPSGQPDFTSMPNTTLVNTDNGNFNAHTGKYVIGITGSSTSINLPIVGSDNPNYNAMLFGSNTTKSLVNPGINTSYDPPFPDVNNWSVSPPSIQTLANSSVSITAHVSTYRSNQFDCNWDGWIQIPAPNTYHFQLACDASYDPSGLSFWFTYLLVTITDVNGVQVNETTASGTPVSSMSTGEPVGTVQNDKQLLTAFLCPGLYHLVGTAKGTSSAVNPNSPIIGDSYDDFSFSCTDCNVPFYQATQTVCTTTTPIPGDASMLNSTFSMPAGQPMLFSAWVRDGQPATSTGVIDTAGSYYNSVVRINDGAQDHDLIPQGPIIEGWQRYEGSFTPSSSGTAKISFINNGSNTLYVDDIRLHPFNAEMKSYVYDPVNLRLTAQLDANNYATFYEYDEEGTLIRTKAETSRGIKTIKETRSSLQKNVLASQTENGNPCGTNCVVAVMHTLSGNNTLSYPVGVFNAHGKLLGNAANQAQYMSLWNADTADANRGVLTAGIDSMHFQLTLNAGKTAPNITGCRYYQFDLSNTVMDCLNSKNGEYADFGDGSGMYIPGDTTGVVWAPNTIAQYGNYIHTYPNTSLKTITLYHNDGSETPSIGPSVSHPGSNATLANVRGYFPAQMTYYDPIGYQQPTALSVAGIVNWNQLTSLQELDFSIDNIYPCTHLSFSQDFMANCPGLKSIGWTPPSPMYYSPGYVDSTFRLSRLKSNWNTYFTQLSYLLITDRQWNREDLSALTNLTLFGLAADNQQHNNNSSGNPVIPLPSSVIDNVIIQIAAGAGQRVNSNGIIFIFGGGGTRTSASNNAYNFLRSHGWGIYMY